MSWNEVSLRDITIELASGGRPKGGAVGSGVFSIGAEHLDGAGGFNLSNPKYIPEEYYFGIVKGKIELYDILIVKDGATTGKVSFVSESFPLVDAAINEHVFRLKLDFTRVDPRYCYFYLRSIGGQQALLSDFRGATVGGISKGILDKVNIPLPPLPIQKHIAEILDAADSLRKKDQELFKKYDELAHAIFIDMFGDPVKNEKGWIMKQIKEIGSVSTGNTPSRSNPEYYSSEYIEWIKSDNIKEGDLYINNAAEYLSKKGADHGRICTEGTLLVCCIAGSLESIGRAAIANREVAFNQQINSVKPTSQTNIIFLYHLFKYCKSYIQGFASSGMKRMLSKSEFEKIPLINPPLEIQNDFVDKLDSLLKTKHVLKTVEIKSSFLFQTLIHSAFSGKLIS